jgi:diaminopropionate ammonia-lyase
MSENGEVRVNFISRPGREGFKQKRFPESFSQTEMEKVRGFHKTIENYMPTPLVKLDNLANYLGIKAFFVKDESKRMGLNSFKMLGGSYAVARVLCEKLNINIEDTTFDYLKSEEVKKKIGQITFSTCSDGNHGRAVAWAAQQLSQKAVIYMPAGTADSRSDAIRSFGADVIVTDVNYDDTVRLNKREAEKNGWEIVQDTSWEGYTKVPLWIMQGYAAMAMEAFDQIKEYGIDKPTHMFIQAGVGAMAGGVLGAVVNLCWGEHPITVVMEPDNAACMYKSAEINDGEPHGVSGELKTMMAGLACGEPVRVGWEVLRDFADAFITAPDYVTARGMRILANPLKGDEKIVSGESGAIGTGLVSLIMQKPELSYIKEKLGLNSKSTVLVYSTEGDTDPVNYRNVLWDGICPLPGTQD